MPEPAVEAAIARGRVASDHLTECRAALFLPMRLLILAFGRGHAEACVLGVFASVAEDTERQRKAIVPFADGEGA